MATTTGETVRTAELCERLGVRRQDVTRWVAIGMPCIGRTRSRVYDLDAVETWLLANGKAEEETDEPAPVATGKICRTYSELARELGMEIRNPERIICRWVTVPGFPGKAGTPGKADGHLPVDEIRDWLANREGGRSNNGGGNDEEYRKLDKDRRRLLLELETRNLHEQLGRLADVEEVARFNRQCVSNAVAILEPLADEVLLLLPADVGPAIRSAVHAKVTELLDNTRVAIAEIIEGDKDESEDTEETDNDGP